MASPWVHESRVAKKKDPTCFPFAQYELPKAVVSMISHDFHPLVDFGHFHPSSLPVAGRNTETKGIRKRRRATSLGRHVQLSRDAINGDIFLFDFGYPEVCRKSSRWFQGTEKCGHIQYWKVYLSGPSILIWTDTHLFRYGSSSNSSRTLI